MKLFELLGVITVNNQDANNKISETTEKTEGLHTKLLNGMETAGKWALKFTAAAATAAVATTAALAKIVSNNTAAMDNIDKQSQRLGMTKKSYQEWSYVMGQCGLNMEQMESGMMALTNKMKEAADPNSEASKAFRMLGVAVTDSEGNLRSVNDVFEETVAAMTLIENEGEKLALADMLFAGSGQLMMPLLNTAYDKIVELKQTANDLGLVLTDEQIAAAVQFVDTTDTLKSAYGSLGTDITNSLLPALQQFYDFLIEKFPTIKTEFVEGFLPALSSIVEGVLGIITALLDPNGEMQLEESINKLVNGIVSIVGKLAEHAPTLVDGLVKLFTALLPHVGTLIDALVPLVTAILNGLIDNLPTILNSLSVASYDIIKALLDKLGLGGLLPDKTTVLSDNAVDDNSYMTVNEFDGTPLRANAPEPSDNIAKEAAQIRELLDIINPNDLKWYGYSPYAYSYMTDEELVEWYQWQNKGAINRALNGYRSTYGLDMPYMDKYGYIHYKTNPNGSEEPFFEHNENWENDTNPDYVNDHNESIGRGDPLGVEYYQKTYGDNWFNHWYEMNKETIDPEDLNWVIDKYDVPTLGSMPMLNTLANSLMMGSNTAFGGIGENTNALVALITNLNDKLDTVINQQAQGKTIVLNTGALVGGIGGAMDKFLGNTVLNKIRG